MKQFFTTLLTLFICTGAFAQVDLQKNLDAYYPFTGDAGDSSSNGYHGTITGATLTTDRFNNPNSAYSFAADDRIVSTYQLPASGDYSVSLWVKSSRPSEGGNYFYCGDPDTDGVTLAEHGTLVCNVTGGNIGNVEMTYFNQTCAAFSNTQKLTKDEWTHLCVVNSGSSLKLYINGVLEASATEPSVGTLSAITSIGKPDPSFQSPSVVGAIDDVRFYSRAVNEQEVNALYNDKSTSSVDAIYAAQFNVYPNPSNGVFTISFNKAGVNVTIINSQGQIIKQLHNVTAEVTIDGLQTGFYIIQSELDGYINRKKIVVQ